MINWIGPDVGLKLINNFKFDYIQDKYHEKQKEICKELDIYPSKCAIFGITDEEHKEFGQYNRGTDWRRGRYSYSAFKKRFVSSVDIFNE